MRQAHYQREETLSILTHQFRYNSFIPESEMEVLGEIGTRILYSGV
jgi:hypothetical protein